MKRLGLRVLTGVLAVATVLTGAAQPAHAWSHQGHILMTRLACLRILDDPTAPAGLKAFLKDHMKFDLESCHRLATADTVGADPVDYQTGLDNWCTMPDRVKYEPGAGLIEPFGAPEAKMHFLDLEYFSKSPIYNDELSAKPKLADVPDNASDPRYRLAGYSPLRVANCFSKLVTALGPGDQPADDDAALKWAGYVAHYIEDSTQPHHGTVDFKSLSYLAGQLKEVHKVTHTLDDGTTAVEYRVDRTATIDPHADFERQIFANAEEPRKTLREKYWNQLQDQIAAMARTQPPLNLDAKFDPFTFSVESFLDSYDNLPLLGRAAQAGYATGTFDVAAYFNAHGPVDGVEMTTLDVFARQNAKAVLAVERIYRLAWDRAHRTTPAPK